MFLFSASSTFAILGFGFLLGLKHATEADHLAAVSTIVTERKSLWSSAFVGGFWGLGHTISLFLAGIFVLLLNFQISEQTERILEFGVGMMLRSARTQMFCENFCKAGIFIFTRTNTATRAHVHPHIHVHEHADEPHTHHGFSISARAR